MVKACWRPVVPTSTGSRHLQPPCSKLGDRRAQVVEGEGEVLAHVGGHGGLNQMDLLSVPGVEPGAGEPEIGTREVLYQTHRLGVEGDAARHVAAR